MIMFMIIAQSSAASEPLNDVTKSVTALPGSPALFDKHD